MDINCIEMHELYMYLKRNSPLFRHKYGKALQIKDHYNKVFEKSNCVQFLCDRYGLVQHYYPPDTQYAFIEDDIKKLL